MLNKLVDSLTIEYEGYRPKEGIVLPIHILITPEIEEYIGKDTEKFISDLASASNTFKKAFNVSISYTFDNYVLPKLEQTVYQVQRQFTQKSIEANERADKNIDTFLQLVAERDILHKTLDHYSSITELDFQIEQLSKDDQLMNNFKINIALREEECIREKNTLGKAYMNKPYAIINYSDSNRFFPGILLHEISHTLGADHKKHAILPTIMFPYRSSRYKSNTRWDRQAKKQIRQKLDTCALVHTTDAIHPIIT